MPYQTLYKNIFRQEPQAGDAFIRTVTEQHPYFSLGHFFLLKQTGLNEAPYTARARRAALFFDNVYLLEHQLHLKKDQPAAPAFHPPHTVEATAPPAGTTPELMKATDLIFEPLHTTDYFASQGIRLSEEQQAQDKLGKQLRSFTDWLKTMKKVHDAKMEDRPAPLDIAVQHLAEKSNKEDEVITEAMAEAYIAQGKVNKAKEVYSKLSLLNPAKSAFFAAKIEQLNEK